MCKTSLTQLFILCQVFESCFGAEVVKERFVKMKEVAKLCKSQPVAFKAPQAAVGQPLGSIPDIFQSNSPMNIRGLDLASLLVSSDALNWSKRVFSFNRKRK